MPIFFLFSDANLMVTCNYPTIAVSGTGFVDDVNAQAFNRLTD
jgi:hypothetical protein